MNERIKELMVELKKTVSTHRGDAVLVGYDEIEKFAELIVLERCQVIDADCQLQMRQRVITNLGGLNQARELIKQHFGVKE